MNFPNIFGDSTNSNPNPNSDPRFQQFVERLQQVEDRDRLIQETLNGLRKHLKSDRIVLYYFYKQWRGQVTFESLRYIDYSIYGSTGADDCFNEQYARLYLEGRISAISDIDEADIDSCHRDFLKSIRVKANLAVPVVKNQQLWGLLIAHYCQTSHSWVNAEIETMKQAAKLLSESPFLD
ncbi:MULTISPECIES: GAF domain-containing protein [Limnospira]|uniref:GAF domain-containing protein n=1 Tax=Limnospira TaxID=2596745 RepID=UPI001448F800|nr:GAF domain-containing protein [Limnospira sp. Paracas R14]QJB26727.1 GAF domain-containing protein [Limnospira fusiformis SAG 85.79]